MLMLKELNVNSSLTLERKHIKDKNMEGLILELSKRDSDLMRKKVCLFLGILFKKIATHFYIFICLVHIIRKCP